MNLSIVVSLSFLIGTSISSFTESPGWQSLFNGKDLRGWKVRCLEEDQRDRDQKNPGRFFFFGDKPDPETILYSNRHRHNDFGAFGLLFQPSMATGIRLSHWLECWAFRFFNRYHSDRCSSQHR